MGDSLNTIGYFLLNWLDYRQIGVFSLAITVVLLAIRGLWQHKMPTLLEVMALFPCVSFIFSGIAVFCVFDLTSPPAFKFLDGSTDGVLGIVVLAATIFSGISGIRQLMKS